MLKVFYLKDNYKDPNFRKSNAIELCLNGIGNTGILIKDRNNDLENFKLIPMNRFTKYTDMFDSFNTYIIDTKELLLDVLEVYNCKVLYTSETVKITVDEAIKLFCASFRK